MFVLVVLPAMFGSAAVSAGGEADISLGTILTSSGMASLKIIALVAFTMAVTGYDPAMTAVYPTSIPADAPSYMPAIAVGDYTKKDLGKTTAGTAVSAWYFAGQEADNRVRAGCEEIRLIADVVIAIDQGLISLPDSVAVAIQEDSVIARENVSFAERILTRRGLHYTVCVAIIE